SFFAVLSVLSLCFSLIHLFLQLSLLLLSFFFHATATTEIYTLSLHDALPISAPQPRRGRPRQRPPLSELKPAACLRHCADRSGTDRKSTRLNSSHVKISYAVFCLKKKKQTKETISKDRTKKKRNKIS